MMPAKNVTTNVIMIICIFHLSCQNSKQTKEISPENTNDTFFQIQYPWEGNYSLIKSDLPNLIDSLLWRHWKKNDSSFKCLSINIGDTLLKRYGAKAVNSILFDSLHLIFTEKISNWQARRIQNKIMELYFATKYAYQKALRNGDGINGIVSIFMIINEKGKTKEIHRIADESTIPDSSEVINYLLIKLRCREFGTLKNTTGIGCILKVKFCDKSEN